MKRELPDVMCIYTAETESTLPELLEESFRLYLRHSLSDVPTYHNDEGPVSRGAACT